MFWKMKKKYSKSTLAKEEYIFLKVWLISGKMKKFFLKSALAEKGWIFFESSVNFPKNKKKFFII